jgi:hypothetical protein
LNLRSQRRANIIGGRVLSVNASRVQLAPFWRVARALGLRLLSRERIFTLIYRGKKWKGRESRSGPGSTLARTGAIRLALPGLLRELSCHSLLDVPCGDFSWMQWVAMDVDYIGGDIVTELIERNRRRYARAHRRFIRLDMIRDALPRADLILCRDGLVHLSHADIFRALENIKASRARYLLTTTFVQRDRNPDIRTGDWRPVNLEAPPFGFPPPVRLIDEDYPREDYRDKRLGLWRVAELPRERRG